MIELFPQYENFTAVEILLSISGQEEKTFSISQTGRFLQSLTIKEGTVGQGEQFSPNLNGDNVASGTINLIDEDNSLFRSLVASKSTNDEQLLNTLKITIYTYSGIRTYDNCRIEKWSVNFNGGVPTITLEWQTLDPSGLPSVENQNNPEFFPDVYNQRLVKEGVTNFSDFQRAIRDIFNSTYTVSLGDGLNENNVIVCGGEKKVGSDNREVGTLRFSAQFASDQTSVLDAVLSEFCRNCTVKNEVAAGLGWVFSDDRRRNIRITKIENYRNRVIKNYGKAEDILNDTVFVYNSSIMQGSPYNTPWGEKTAFVVNTINATYSFENVIVSNLEQQANSSNPNGNIVITSKGRVMIPSNLPQAVTSTIHNLTSMSLRDTFTVTITVYNYIHFYILGEVSACHLVVFDHLGQIHPISGRMRVFGYEYTIGDGVVSANVTLKPMFGNEEDSFYNLSNFYLRDFTTTGRGDVIEIEDATVVLSDSQDAENERNINYQNYDMANSSSSGIVNTGVGTGLNVCLTLDDCI